MNWDWCDAVIGFIIGYGMCVITIWLGILIGEHKN